MNRMINLEEKIVRLPTPDNLELRVEHKLKESLKQCM